MGSLGMGKSRLALFSADEIGFLCKNYLFMQAEGRRK